ncbi:MAG TPA: rRNA maturation RNase YbeY [Gallionella sp.]|nr:rRNA maturation RNase YbeY [Gallionella sp.]
MTRAAKRNLSSGLSLTVQYASSAQHLPTRAQFRRWIKAALHPQGVRRQVPGSFAATLPLQRDAKVTLRIVDEAEGRELNKNYRGKDYATNVLTFVYDDMPELAGDIVICAPVVELEAVAQHRDLAAHYAHLSLHAALHLQGYGHENDADAAGMEQLEIDLMLKLGYPDPYRI